MIIVVSISLKNFVKSKTNCGTALRQTNAFIELYLLVLVCIFS